MPTLDVKNIRPLPGYVVVEPVESQRQTESGIYLPESNEEKPQMGTVIAVSASYVNEHGAKVECPVKLKDTVLYKKWGGNEVKVGSKELQVMKFEDLIAVISSK